MKVKLHTNQLEIARDPSRFRVVAAGRRFGKSVLARMQVLKWATEKQGLYFIVSPTYKQSKMIHWREIQKEIPKDWIAKTNKTELSIELLNGSIIELKGAENPDALRGVKLSGLVIDEIASIRNWDWLWSEVLRPTLTDNKAPALFISTPMGYNHFYDLYKRGQLEGNDYKSWHFTSYDNPTIPHDDIDAAQDELTEDAFHQEYLAEFRKFTGAVFKTFSREVHVIDPFDVPREWDRSRGFDYGSAHYTASIRVATDNDGNHFIEHSYFDNARTIKEHAEAIRSQDYGFSHVQSWGDPSGAQWFIEFAQHGVHIQPAIKETGQAKMGWVEYCIEKVNELFKSEPGHVVYLPDKRKIKNAPKLFILDKPENKPLIDQIENIKWRQTADNSIIPKLDEGDDPTGGHYDLIAALRYWAVSHHSSGGGKKYERVEKEFPQFEAFKGGFY